MRPALLVASTLVTVIKFCPLTLREIEIVEMETQLTVSYRSGQSSLNGSKLEEVEAPSLTLKSQSHMDEPASMKASSE